MEEVSSIRIFPAGSFDAAIITDFFAKCVEEYPYMAGILRHAEWPQKLAERADCICVTDNGGKLCGALFCYCNDQVFRVAYIPFLAVLSACRAYASGVDLHNRYLSHARAQGMKEARLEVDDFNVRALKFYEKIGYHEREKRGNKVLLWTCI